MKEDIENTNKGDFKDGIELIDIDIDEGDDRKNGHVTYRNTVKKDNANSVKDMDNVSAKKRKPDNGGAGRTKQEGSKAKPNDGNQTKSDGGNKAKPNGSNRDKPDGTGRTDSGSKTKPDGAGKDKSAEKKTAIGDKGKKSKKKTVIKVVLRILLVFVTFVGITFAGAYMTLKTICHGPSKAARDLFVSTILETGQMKFLASWYFTEEEILAITDRNGMVHNEENVDPGLVVIPTMDDNTPNPEFDINGIELVEIAGRSFFAKMLIINDPSRVKLSTIYPWSDWNKNKYGETLEQLVKRGDYLAGINGGEYYSDGNWGGIPKGLVVADGEILYNAPQAGDVMVGFNEDNILMIMDIGNMSAEQVTQLVADNRIRDAVSFKDIDDGDNNHFTKLIINGTATLLSGKGSGANPRTVIGQRADGTVLMLVTDGRGSAGHLGATAQDLISIMQEYGALNAANLDGGSSSAMYYNDAYEMTSVTLYYSTYSWNLPTGFVVEKRGE